MKLNSHIPVSHSVEPPPRTANAVHSRKLTSELSFRRFLLIAATAFLLTWAAVWAYVAALPMAYEGRDYPLALAKRDLIAECRPDEVAVFGDSRAVAGILPTAMKLPVENLAYPGASPVETYFFLKRLLRCPQLPRLVVIAHSASMYPKDEYFWSLFAALGVLSAADINDVEADARRLGDNELRQAERPSAIPYTLLPGLYAIRFPPLYFGPLLTGYVAARWRYNERAYHEAIASSGRSSFGTANGFDGASDEVKMTDWRVSPLVDLYLGRSLALLAARHVPVVVLSMPISASTCARLPAAISPRFATYLDTVARSHPNVKLVDPSIPCWPDRYYGDAWHFNMSGTLAYSRKLEIVLAAVLRDRQDAAAPAFPQNGQELVARFSSNHEQHHDD